MPAAKPLPTLAEIEARCVKTPGGCWEWQGAFCGEYPCMRRGGILYKVHRLSYELFHGVELGTLLATHTCHNKPCVNPGHIFPGDKTSNARDHFDRIKSTGGVHKNTTSTGSGYRAKISIHGRAYRRQFPTEREALQWLQVKREELYNGER